ncbi:flagellar hook protein FlgE [Rhodoferax sp. GW822-FHT02A01]|uniref:flagellar hook protein FlgE n=1 Tax=Rhodoferax sp. GW822-FHT02A01 TaxID=3141537 RepID=UPI00315DF65E
MSFQTGLSGLNASSQSLDVIGNNIANANTIGMKSSRAEFADLVASTIGAGGANVSPGIGTAVGAISQQFTQGNVSITGNSLDIAINGSGFFQLTKPDGTTAYSRNGQFKLDKDGNIVTNTGANLMGYPTDTTGAATSTTPQKLALPTGASIPAKVTGTITAEMNLDARAPIASATTAPGQYGTSVVAYDTQGNQVPLSLYFVKSANNTWSGYTDLTAAQTAITSADYSTANATLVFSTTGTLISPTAATSITLNSPYNGIGNFNVQLDLTKATQYGTDFAVSNLTQDGYTAGNFTGLSIDSKGVITTTYSNGQTMKNGGMVALANFRNTQGLTPTGGGEYTETFKSGQAQLGKPTIGNYGELRSGALEESNVDLTAELVNMMTAQRAYQANAQTIKTQDQIMSTLVNLR